MVLDPDLIKRLGSSKFNYWFGYVANAALVLWLVSRAFTGWRCLLSPLAFAGWATFGLVSWTLTEYLLHRYVYHVWTSFLSTGHAFHHKAPRDLIGVPWWVSTIIIVSVYYGLSLAVPPAVLAVVMAFNWLGYIGYCLAHHGSHHWSFKIPWLREMKKHHLLHHAHPEYNWGFTTSMWDVLFGTDWSRSPQGRQRAQTGAVQS